VNPERLVAEAAEVSRAAYRMMIPPGSVTGTDGSGQIEVRLAPDGFPDQILVAESWARRLEPDGLGTAVVEAAQNAGRAVLQQRPVDRDPAPVADPFGGGQVRAVEELAEAVIRALQDAATSSAKVIAELERPSAADGTDDSGHVRVTITGGSVTGCQIDNAWATRQNGHSLGAALTQAALRAAASSTRPDTASGDALLADVLATQRYQYRMGES
jgi:DNA-binding protein YbaB